MTKFLEIGKITNTHGVKGYVKLVAETDDVKKFSKLIGKTLYVSEKLIPVKIEDVKYQAKFVLLKFEGIETIEDAEKFKGKILQISREDEPGELPENTYYIVDLIGFDVINDDGKNLGKLQDIYDLAGQTMFDVKGQDGKITCLPNRDEIILKIDMENKQVLVHFDYSW